MSSTTIGPLKEFHLYQKLPLELRLMVIEHTMRAGGHLGRHLDIKDYLENSCAANPRFLPAICAASNQTHIEATPVYIRNTVWVVRSKIDIELLTAFLATMPNEI